MMSLWEKKKFQRMLIDGISEKKRQRLTDADITETDIVSFKCSI